MASGVFFSDNAISALKVQTAEFWESKSAFCLDIVSASGNFFKACSVLA